MEGLFVRPDGSPMQFHLADLNVEQQTKYTLLIEDSGGKVEAIANENVLTFTVPDKSLKYDYVFDVKFIDDCIEQKTFMDINLYYLGDQRHNKGCLISKGFTGNSQCLCFSMLKRGLLKSTERKDKQTKLDKNTTQDTQSETNVIDESDSEDAIASSPLLNKTGVAKNLKIKLPEITELSKTSASREKSNQDSVMILSRKDDADKNDPDENSKRIQEKIEMIQKKLQMRISNSK